MRTILKFNKKKWSLKRGGLIVEVGKIIWPGQRDVMSVGVMNYSSSNLSILLI